MISTTITIEPLDHEAIAIRRYAILCLRTAKTKLAQLNQPSFCHHLSSPSPPHALYLLFSFSSLVLGFLLPAFRLAINLQMLVVGLGEK